MSRSRASAKAAGTRFETLVARYLAENLDDRIERRARSGSCDRGDLGGIRTIGNGRVVAECKDTAKISLGTWQREAEIERGNDDAIAGIVISKRHGVGDPAQQWVHMTLRDFVAVLTGQRPEETQ